MAAVPPPPARRRPRPGSLQRPVNAKLYRGTWLLVGLPLLIAAFSVARPQPLPPPEQLSALDGAAIKSLAGDLILYRSNRYPASAGAINAAGWFRDQLRPYGLHVRTERFSAVVPRAGRLQMENLLAVAPGRSPQTIVVMAHRDNDGTGPGANDNASGTALLVELARAYSVLTPAHTIVFLSTDGGAFGGLGAAEFAAHSPERHGVVAVINLDAIGSSSWPRLQIGGDTPRTTSGTLLETAAARIAKQAGRGPARPSVLRQLIDLGFPFSPYEQAPFISRGIPAVTLTTGGDRPQSPDADTFDRLDATRLGQVGRAAQDLLGTLDQGAEFVQGTSSYVNVGARLIRGWAIELVLMAMLLPFFAAAVDLFARCRRRRIALAPALRSYRSRLAFWAWVAAVFELFALLQIWPGGTARPPELTGSAARDWSAFGVLMLGMLTLAGWLVARDRLLPHRPVTAEEELAGHTVALLALAALSLLVVATNPFALLFLLPSLHVWLWLPNMRLSPSPARAALIVAGFAGPALVVGSFAFRYGLGWDAPWYLLELRALGYVPFVVIVLAIPWLAGAGQLAALAAGRYAPYPEVGERPRLGPARRLLRRLVLGARARRRAPQDARRALGG
ncbi:MAG: M28 family peptidase [Gaiellaceae bacterium]